MGHIPNTSNLTTVEQRPQECERSWLFSDDDMLYTYLGFLGNIILLSTFASTILQVYVIRKAIRHIRRGTSDQCLHIFLLSMTMGDLVLTGITYPLELLNLNEILTFDNKYVHIFMHYVTWVGLLASSLSLILLNIDKLLYFKYPLTYQNYVTRKRGFSIAIFVWCGCVIFVGSAWIMNAFECKDVHCFHLGIFENRIVLYLIFMVTACIIPSMASLVVALYILKMVSSHRKRLAEEQALYSQQGNHDHSHTLSTRLRTFYFIFMTTIFTVATLLPHRIASMNKLLTEQNLNIAGIEKPIKTCSKLALNWTCYFLMMLNAILNPLLTVTVLPQYRSKALKKFLSGSSDPSTRATEM